MKKVVLSTTRANKQPSIQPKVKKHASWKVAVSNGMRGHLSRAK